MQLDVGKHNNYVRAITLGVFFLQTEKFGIIIHGLFNQSILVYYLIHGIT